METKNITKYDATKLRNLLSKKEFEIKYRNTKDVGKRIDIFSKNCIICRYDIGEITKLGYKFYITTRRNNQICLVVCKKEVK